MFAVIKGDIDVISVELECLTDNLDAVHTAMEEDGGANWKSMCNAVFSVWRQLYRLQKELAEEVERLAAEHYTQEAGATGGNK